LGFFFFSNIPAKVYDNLFWHVKTIFSSSIVFCYCFAIFYHIARENDSVVTEGKLSGHVFGVIKWFKSEPNVLWNGKILFLVESETCKLLPVRELHAHR